jgi:membrane protease YdiL (CAAX protease family)
MSTPSQVGASVPVRSASGALAVCAAMFIAFLLVDHVTNAGITKLVGDIAAPNGAPPMWWMVDKRLLVIGLADLIAGVGLVAVYCRLRHVSFIELGYNRGGTWKAWLLVLAVQAGLIALDVRGNAVGHAPGAFGFYALSMSAFVGVAAAIAEETFFRGFVMEEMRRGGFGPVVQVVASMLLFGGAHYSYSAGPGGLTVPILTGLVGGFWSIIYLMGRRSLWPVIVAHIINDAIVIPSAYYVMMRSGMH